MVRDDLPHSLAIDSTVPDWLWWLVDAPALELAEPAPSCTWSEAVALAEQVVDRPPMPEEFARMVDDGDFYSIMAWFRPRATARSKRFTFLLARDGEVEPGWTVWLTPWKGDDFYLWDTEFREILATIVRRDSAVERLNHGGMRVRIGVEFDGSDGLNDVAATCHSAEDVMTLYDGWVSTLGLR